MLTEDCTPCATVPFKAWTGHRHVESLSTTAGLSPLAFQRWRPFKEAFAPEVVERAFSEAGRRVRHVIDPCGGSGTTALASQFLGAKPTTIEVNPYLADLIEAKLAAYDLDEIALALRSVCKKVMLDKRLPLPEFLGAPRTFVEPGIDGRYIFSVEIASRLISYKHAIEAIPSRDIRRLFRVLLGSILIPVSNVTLSGKGRRYRRSWETRTVSANTVNELFQERVLNAIYDLRLFHSRACRDYRVLRGDCRQLLDRSEPADLAVFSPPYPNSFDYTDVYNVELWVLGYLRSSSSNKDLRNATIRSHVQIKRDMNGGRYRSKALSRTLRALDEARSSLWNREIPEMVGAYVSDIGMVMGKLRARLVHGGRVYMVVGNSRYAGVDIPVAEILCEIAHFTGLRNIRSEECRSMRVSPQQGGREELTESLLIFEKQ